MERTIVIHAKERGVAPIGEPRCARLLEVVSYDMVITPARPIKIGQRVSISRLERTPNRYDGPFTPPPQYESCRTDVQGRVTGIRALERHFTELIVRNENPQSLVAVACVSVPHIQGITIELESWRWIFRTVMAPFLPSTRRVAIEWDPVVIPDDIRWDGEDDGGGLADGTDGPAHGGS
ncbi:hypothetical protein PYCCODRAFT_1375788 [Trametes coccinea BRFM310]|uniref:Uncharacterized protein n=1 Tax=Trametes coccinea (strain BRFM310) TaxID=1353009 RepID=A0A1Y2IAM0_TRAC3|nr:hypothetical protein PYCCODRAFT_1375788 [Trametes coccinea BRFM310]